MNWDHVIGLASAYGFEVAEKDIGQMKIRFRNEHTFVDVWQGMKGTTVGVYNPQTKRAWFKRKANLETLEDCLIEASKYGN